MVESREALTPVSFFEVSHSAESESEPGAGSYARSFQELQGPKGRSREDTVVRRWESEVRSRTMARVCSALCTYCRAADRTPGLRSQCGLTRVH
jgi:hypothetical protein